MIRVTPHLELDERELVFRTSRASGPGGQHVNRTESRVEVVLDVDNSPSLSSGQRMRLHENLGHRISGDGLLVVAVQDERSQLRNKELAVERLVSLIAQALHIPKVRRKTKPSKGAKERRMQGKKRRSDVKAKRGRVDE